MLRKVFTTMAAVAALSALVMVSQAGAADKLVVKGTDGATTVFKATDDGRLQNTGNFTTSLATTYLQESLNAGTQRYVLRADGVPYWQMNSGTAEAGQIAYATPGGGAGIVMYTTNWTNRMDFINYGTYGTFSFNGVTPSTLNVTKTGNVGVSVTTPSQKLEVNGGVRLNPALATAQPACDANAIGTLWSSQGSGILQFCNGTAWKQVVLQ
jgi:hypothetical protein